MPQALAAPRVLPAASPPALYLLGDQPVTLEEFIEQNNFDPEEVASIANLAPGKSLRFGGGAAPVFTLRRLPEPRSVAALNLEVPGERAAHDLVQRFTSGRWPRWRVLGVRRVGIALLVAVQWLRTQGEPFALVEVALHEASLRWRHHADRRALLAALHAEQEQEQPDRQQEDPEQEEEDPDPSRADRPAGRGQP